MTDRGHFDERVLVAIGVGINRAAQIREHLGIEPYQDKILDKALQRLRNAGQIEYVGGRWKPLAK